MFPNPQLAARDFVLGCLPTNPLQISPEANGDSLAASAVALRQYLAETVENLIDLLDELDGDPDEEANGDDEPSLAGGNCVGNFHGGIFSLPDPSFAQRAWAYGALDDRELDPCDQGEPEEWI